MAQILIKTDLILFEMGGKINLSLLYKVQKLTKLLAKEQIK